MMTWLNLDSSYLVVALGANNNIENNKWMDEWMNDVCVGLTVTGLAFSFIACYLKDKSGRPF